MRIAINTRFLQSEKMEGFGWYTYEVVKRLVNDHPEHDFFFFFDRKFDPSFVFASNVTPLILNPPARHPVLFIWWFEVSVRNALKEYKIDLFFSPDGYLSLSSPVKQVITIHDINFEHHPKDLPWSARFYLKNFFPRFARKASEIITVSSYSLNDICKTYQLDPKKISFVWNGVAEEYSPLEDRAINSTRERYSEGQPYFLFVGSIHPRKNVLRLLRAFKVFKHRTNSRIKLMLVGTAMWQSDKAIEALVNELGEDVIVTGHLKREELHNVVGSAYALTFAPYYEGFGIPVAEAMKCGVPVICGNRTSLPEVAGDAALLCDPFDEGSICDQMILLTKDVTIYDDLKQKGLTRSKLFSWDLAAEHIWSVLEKQLK